MIRMRWCLALGTLLLPGGAAAQEPIPAPAGSPDRWAVPASPAPAPIPAQEYAARRQRLLSRIGAGVLVILGSDEPDSDYMTYAQNASFRYFTGLTEPGAALVVDNRRGVPRAMLF